MRTASVVAESDVLVLTVCMPALRAAPQDLAPRFDKALIKRLVRSMY